jgi:hypothetical protein
MSTESVERVTKDMNEYSVDTKPMRRRLSVSFTTVEVKEYAVILGDNPEARYPLALDWVHTESRTMRINDCDVRRTGEPCRLDADSRIDRLRDMGFSKKDLRVMERDRKMSLLNEWRNSQHSDNGDEILPPPGVMRMDPQRIISQL